MPQINPGDVILQPTRAKSHAKLHKTTHFNDQIKGSSSNKKNKSCLPAISMDDDLWRSSGEKGAAWRSPSQTSPSPRRREQAVHVVLLRQEEEMEALRLTMHKVLA